MNSINLPLVDWGTGTAFLVVFLAISVIMVLVVLNMMRGDKEKD
ncbi:MAG: hypothetical protein AAF466_03010 [Bacteroidota bacterium]